MEDITQLGIGGIFALMVIKEVFAFLKSKKNGHSNGDSNGVSTKVLTMSSQIDELYRMHSVKDLEGRPIWYFPTHLDDNIQELSKNINSLSRSVEILGQEMREIKSNRHDFKS